MITRRALFASPLALLVDSKEKTTKFTHKIPVGKSATLCGLPVPRHVLQGHIVPGAEICWECLARETMAVIELNAKDIARAIIPEMPKVRQRSIV